MKAVAFGDGAVFRALEELSPFPAQIDNEEWPLTLSTIAFSDMDFIITLLRLGVPQFLIKFGVFVVTVAIGLRKVRGVSIVENRRWLGLVGATLIITGAALWSAQRLWPSAISNPKTQRTSDYAIDTGKIKSLFLSKNGGLQVYLDTGFEESAHAWHGSKEFWAVGDDLPDVVKQALTAAKARDQIVRIVTVGMKGDKFVIREVYIGDNR